MFTITIISTVLHKKYLLYFDKLNEKNLGNNFKIFGLYVIFVLNIGKSWDKLDLKTNF